MENTNTLVSENEKKPDITNNIGEFQERLLSGHSLVPQEILTLFIKLWEVL
jgi:hypothetical protein